MNKLQTKESILMALEYTKSVAEWNMIVVIAQREYGGYPDWWYPEVIATAMMERVAASWIVPISPEIQRIVLKD